MPEKENPALEATSKPGSENNSHSQSSKPLLKWKRVLAAFVNGRSFNRFEAERELRDHCLHSTVSTIQSKGVRIERRDEVVPGYQDIPTHVCRYWLAPEHRWNAQEILAGGRKAT